MLPYSLRHPIYGGQLKKRKQASLSPAEVRNVYNGGGPVQRAIEQDLLALLPAFESQLTADISSVISIDTMPRPGTAFRAFRTVFGGAKVALLHTRLIPQRCDPTAYSQLLYASCLSLLKQTLQNYDDTADTTNFPLMKAAHAVFCLYTSYETNPLPIAPSSDKDKLAMLPMAQSNRENSKLLHRRSFRADIRIDPAHYSLILQTRDTALSIAADCQASDVGSKDEEVRDDKYRQYAVAADLVNVLDRLCCHLEPSAYTGPCSAEGLAGHADYPFPISMQARADHKTFTEPPDVTVQTAAHTLDEVVPKSAHEFSDELQIQLKHYLSSRRAIRLPAVQINLSQQSKRIRQALEPMFQQPEEGHIDALIQLADSISQEDESAGPRTARRVAFGPMMADAPSVTKETVVEDTTGVDGTSQEESASTEQAAIHADDFVAIQKRSSYQLVLPVGMSATMQESIQAAVETLLNRHGSVFNFSMPQVSHSIQGDVSTTWTRSLSVASITTAATGVERNALRDLLSRVEEEQASQPASVATAVTGVGRDALRDLLSRVDGEQARQPASVATAVPGVGRNTLRDLLSRVDEEQASQPASVATVATGVGRSTLRDLLSRVDEEQAIQPASVATAATGLGRNALLNLLSRVDGDQATQPASVVTAASGVGPTLRDPLSRVDVEQASGVGRTALRDLLSRVGEGQTTKPVGSGSKESPQTNQVDLFWGREGEDGIDEITAGKGTMTTNGGELSDLSSDEEAASVALSTVGRRALTDLLSTAHQKHTCKRKKSAERLKFSAKRQEALESIVDSEGSNDDTDAESAQSELAYQGKAALDSLLELAAVGGRR